MNDRSSGVAPYADTAAVRPAQIWRHPVHIFSFGFGSGLAPVAPGTAGTLAAVPLYAVLAPLEAPFYLGTILLLFLLGVWFCDATARALGVHDHPAIVWDEVVGYLVTMAAVPVTWYSVLAGFLLFRLFDITKPWPIRWIDRRVEGGFGIMFDDVLAGGFAWAVLQLLLFVL